MLSTLRKRERNSYNTLEMHLNFFLGFLSGVENIKCFVLLSDFMCKIGFSKPDGVCLLIYLIFFCLLVDFKFSCVLLILIDIRHIVKHRKCWLWLFNGIQRRWLKIFCSLFSTYFRKTNSVVVYRWRQFYTLAAYYFEHIKSKRETL